MSGENRRAVTLDHVGLLVPDLTRAAEDFAALGFTLTARAAHLDGDGNHAGSEQCSIMLRDGYIELQEITGPPGSHLLSRAQAKHFGLHIIAFGVADARAAALDITGLPLSPVMDWSRPVRRPGVEGEARFSFFVADYDPADEALLCWTQHRTPELLRDGAVLDHANGAQAIAGFRIYCEASEEATLAARLVAAGGIAVASGVRFGAAEIAIGPGSLPRADWPAAPFCGDLRISVAETDAAATAARGRGFAVETRGDATCLDLLDPYGIRLILEIKEPA
ncbi:MAG: VOC family protein [Pseudomonadota bacterium]